MLKENVVGKANVRHRGVIADSDLLQTNRREADSYGRVNMAYSNSTKYYLACESPYLGMTVTWKLPVQ